MVLSFLLVVIKTGVNWNALFKGFFCFHIPADKEGLTIVLGQLGAAVGVNMTFLYPYTMLARNRSKNHFITLADEQLRKMVTLSPLLTYILVRTFLNKINNLPVLLKRENKMKSFFLCMLVVFVFLGTDPITASAPSIKIILSDPLELGSQKYLFSSISSVCEDGSGNFYVLDPLERKALKFDPNGNLILTFGQKGQGPGDFQSPGRIILTEQGQLAVCEDMYDVSFHRADGSFIKRVHLSNRLALGYIGENLYYAWSWGPKDQQQVTVDPNNKVVKKYYSIAKNSFSVSAPDESGRMVMFSYRSDIYAPELLFAHNASISAVARSTVYEIILLDSKGNELGYLKRDIQPEKINRTERNYLKKEIKEFADNRGWPPKVTQDLYDLVPRNKAFFNHICLSGQYAFVFRIPEDISKEKSPVLVDVFSLDGNFLGTAELPSLAEHISKNHMYFIETDEEGNVFLSVRTYKIQFHSPE